AYNSRIRNGRNSQWKDVSPWLSEEHEPAYPLIYLPSDNLQFWVRHLDECHSISAYITLFLVACPTSSNILHLFSQSSIMLCGKFDRRRGGHRCMACRRAHKKCDGGAGKACSYCTERLMKCSYASGSPKQDTLRVVQFAPRKAIVLDNWRYTTACFEEAFGSLMQFSVLQGEEMISLSQKDAGISQVVSTIGEIYMCRTNDYPRFLERREVFQELAAKQRAACCQQMQSRSVIWSNAPLACALMLVAIEMMLFGNIDPCMPWMTDASDYIERTTSNMSDLPSFDKDLIRLAQLIDVVNSISRAQNPAGFDFVDARLKTEFPTGNILYGPTPLLNKDADYILSALWHWAVLQQRMIIWSVDAQFNPILSPEKKIEGIELICAASSLQTKILQSYMNLSTLSEAHYNMLAPYSFWILIGISQQLRNEQWSTLECDIPALPDDCLHQYAIDTLDCIGAMAGKAGILVASFISIVFTMGLEMVSDEDRRKAYGLLDIQQARYFEISDHFKFVLNELWSLNLRNPTEFYMLKMAMGAKGLDFRPARGIDHQSPELAENLVNQQHAMLEKGLEIAESDLMSQVL
ncbi:unnamed protein product, partial [Clonostachys chloroleuca]